MDSCEDTATLEWWANRSTCLGRFRVRFEVRAAGGNWTCAATFEPPLTAEGREGFDFLMHLDPCFTLRSDDMGALFVGVAEAGVEGRLILTAAETDVDEPSGARQLPHQ
ncbi:hypothetical protein GCM10010277_68730 [Streptomyces longisporoflavus]|uniref:hypothetical protein n=1 Tax=Streptomyces longisporoflavus TaxID=28044 RepID=UPI00167E1724|nr:hypothetical protein [Streptomyces longisporoflavus]GGV62978.1 hypothetical protein GCM10010277_68730 [Streptomyces longisporoflavus]